jgi:type 1 fimbriae regulatory protein FimB
LPLPDIPWGQFYQPSPLHEQRMISQNDLIRVLAELKKNYRNARMMRCGVLLAYYFGLRVSELCHLRLGDLWLAGTPTVLVWNSKGNHSRAVEIPDLTPTEKEILRDEYRRRQMQTGGDRSAPLLVNHAGRPVSRQQFARLLHQAMQRSGTAIRGGEKALVAHGLRHACANRWWMQGISLVEIARRLGHKSIDTTIKSYLHTAMILHREQQSEIPSECSFQTISNRALAGILGLSRRGARYWWERNQNGRLALDSMITFSPQSSGYPIDGIVAGLQEELSQVGRLPKPDGQPEIRTDVYNKSVT